MSLIETNSKESPTLNRIAFTLIALSPVFEVIWLYALVHVTYQIIEKFYALIW